eukprot:scaffold135968_cov136-Phaeocystis_antarctica.AAC.1
MELKPRSASHEQLWRQRTAARKSHSRGLASQTPALAGDEWSGVAAYRASEARKAPIERSQLEARADLRGLPSVSFPLIAQGSGNTSASTSTKRMTSYCTIERAITLSSSAFFR